MSLFRENLKTNHEALQAAQEELSLCERTEREQTERTLSC
jgi:hypothetical protein